ncbi:MAG: RES family NAD+ phosphorylase [Actinomycetia bacterium]|nr:RES family NAD+ phosphorylase [Actinomycetes bacterium]MCP4962022.1 RES family NAD+ phosphorylase [Actinomycetes bacterium]
MTDLAEPPRSGLDRFPRRTLRGDTRLFRIHHANLSPCWYSGFPEEHPNAGRFDLKPPRGTSYWALRPEAAFLETLARRPVSTIPIELIDRYALSEVRLPSELACANSPVQRARGFGLTAEFHTTVDYTITRGWATALHRAGFRALLSIPRHDVTARLRSLALFGRAGEHLPKGWASRLSTAPIGHRLLDRMATWGIRCLPIPHDVETIAPPND